MRLLLLIALAIVAAGCTERDRERIADPQSIDQCMRREIFKECMAALPAGPKATMYNDWGEVVSACESAAYWQSVRRHSQVKPECRP